MISHDTEGGRAFLAPVLASGKGQESRARALALYGDSLFAFWQGAREDSRRRSEEALSAASAADDPEALTLANLALSRVAFLEYDLARACDFAARALENARLLEPSMAQAPLHMYAQGTRHLGDYGQAAALFEESLALNRRIRDERMIAVELHNLGHVELRRGNVEAAERCFGELAQRGAAEDPYGVVMTHLNEAAVAFARGNRERAGELLAASSRCSRKAEPSWPPTTSTRLIISEPRSRSSDEAGTIGRQLRGEARHGPHGPGESPSLGFLHLEGVRDGR